MKRFVPLLASLVALLALGLVIARATDAAGARLLVNGESAARSMPGSRLAVQAPVDTASSPTTCTLSYTYTVSAGMPVAAPNYIGASCFQCTISVTLPFPFTFYGQTYYTVTVENQGNLQFLSSYTSTQSCPLPIAQLGPAILPYWSFFTTYWGGGGAGPCVQVFGKKCGVYDAVSGTEPNRLFDIQWIGVRVGSNQEVLNFEARLHESTGVIEFMYGVGAMFGSSGSVGLQDGEGGSVTYTCNTEAPIQGTIIRWTPVSDPCGSPSPTSTPTSTPTNTPTSTSTTPSPTPITCTVDYTYTVSGGNVITATDPIGLVCQRCARSVSLPFPFTFYGQTYYTVTVVNQGNLQFAGSDLSDHSCPFPITRLGPAALPFWSQFVTYWGGSPPGPCVENYGMPCGVYTSVSGSAPDRIFNIQWIGRLEGSNHETTNFEARLHEGTGILEFAYGIGIQFAEFGSVGIQDGASRFVSYACDTSASIQHVIIRWTPVYGSCLSLTPTVTPTNTPRPTETNTGTPSATGTPTLVATATSTLPTSGTATEPVPPSTFTSVPAATSTPTQAVATPTICSVRFTDVPEGSTFYTYITCLACRGIISGYGDNTFRPGNNITRGQLAKVVSNGAGFSDQQTEQIFQDVPSGSTFFQFIGRLASRGYMGGYPCGGEGEPCGPGDLPYFRQNSQATRGQISKIVANAAGFGDPPGNRIFEDVPEGSTFFNSVQRLATRGVMSGYPCGGPGEPCGTGNRPYFRPNANATRGQTSKIVSLTFFPGCQAAAPKH